MKSRGNYVIISNRDTNRERAYYAHSANSDLREGINPKHPAPDADFTPKPYYQVFAQRHGFLPNLSILDLLMNEGNESILYL